MIFGTPRTALPTEKSYILTSVSKSWTAGASPRPTVYLLPFSSLFTQKSAFAEQLQSVIGGAYPKFAKQTSFLRQQKLHVPKAHFILHLIQGGRTQFAPNGVAADFSCFSEQFDSNLTINSSLCRVDRRKPCLLFYDMV